ncbi:coiled-coil domain-containing protein 85C [Diabrotica virgifera virgifera]|uniref:Coiled-coil domain-containing protein 85C n=1 Tax=Diabrotica virgifera virgifera TaxID=50390 RepID=A0A6P7FDI7_DIAVI|nr:coiled-coil domain-containing protein 85C [Diabrotica virgifera virgifera]
MSNKKAGVKTNAEPAVLPPRYQPPPMPTGQGILKNSPTEPAKKPPKTGENVKLLYPNDPHAKFFPNPQARIHQYPPPLRQIPDEVRTTQLQIHHENPPPRPRLPEESGAQQIHLDLRVPQQRQPIRYDDEFLRPEMLKFVRKPDDPRFIDPNRQFQGILLELRSLKEANQHLADDNQELRDLCCFLDDDRQKGRKLAREWQRFGRYTASVMRQEVSAYQTKLRELDNKQQELIKDNLELKELCLYLDEERGNGSLCPSCGNNAGGNLRDDGDGSSSSTNADEPAVPQQFSSGANPQRRSESRERILHENLARQRNTFNDQIMQYVRSLEQRVKQLEEDKRALTHKINQIATTTGDPSLAAPQDLGGGMLTGRPEAVVRALQVLEVREQLERESHELGVENMSDTTSQDMDDGEKALVREMCNVVWRKLEDPNTTRR